MATIAVLDVAIVAILWWLERDMLGMAGVLVGATWIPFWSGAGQPSSSERRVLALLVAVGGVLVFAGLAVFLLRD